MFSSLIIRLDKLLFTGRPPGPEMENSVDRESYSLAAGLALGHVVLGQGAHLAGLADLAMPDKLHYYMVGGRRRPLTGNSLCDKK